MSFSAENGYTPTTIENLMDLVMAGVNEQFGTSYTTETFIGTGYYKYFYALIQRLQENEVKTSEIFLKMQSYFEVTNESLARPNTTAPGMIDYFKAQGFSISVKPPIEAEAGELRVAVDLDDGADDYDSKKLQFATLLKTCVPAGIATIGDETQAIVLSNSQSFDFNFNLATHIPIKLRVTITLSNNNTYTILSDEEIAELLFENVNARYGFGFNFEPQRYFSVVDAPWGSEVLVEYSLNGGVDWVSDIAELQYDELYTFELTDISVVQS